jgi:hypothetical protein
MDLEKAMCRLCNQHLKEGHAAALKTLEDLHKVQDIKKTKPRYDTKNGAHWWLFVATGFLWCDSTNKEHEKIV